LKKVQKLRRNYLTGKNYWNIMAFASAIVGGRCCGRGSGATLFVGFEKALLEADRRV
jgi:hypothetical protein